MPFSTGIIFGFVLILAIASIISGVFSYYGIKPFGVFSNILAQITSTITDNSSINTVSEYKVIDTFGRSLVMNPGNKTDPVKSVAELNGKLWGMDLISKSGVNMGSFAEDLHPLKFINGDVNDDDLEMSFIVFSPSSDGNVDQTVDFINEAVDRGKMPIVRLCIGPCNFIVKDNAQSVGESIANFYIDVAQKLEGSDAQFIAALGPNEPGTGDEMLHFLGTTDVALGYSILPQAANIAAERLQIYRGDIMYLAPGIFNITNTQNDDFFQYTEAPGSINPELFDYILGNTYEFFDLTAYDFYAQNFGQRSKSVKQYVEDHDMGFIVTEYGSFVKEGGDTLSTEPGGYAVGPTAMDLLKASYNQFCNDPNVDAINFFRPFSNAEYGKEIPDPKQKISLNQVKEIISGCSQIPQKLTKSTRWLNANFDSCIAPATQSAVLGVSDVSKEYCAKVAGKNEWISFGDSLAGTGESMKGITDAKIVAFSGQGALDFLEGNTFFDPDLNELFENNVVNGNAFAVRIILGTNDCRVGSNIDSFERAISNIVERIKAKSIPILVTIPGDPDCDGGAASWNSRIKKVATEQNVILLDAASLYTKSDLRDDRHLKDYDALNNETRKILEESSKSCNTSLKLGNLPTGTDSAITNRDLGTSIYVNYESNFGLGNDAKLNSCAVVPTTDTSYSPEKGPLGLVVPSGNGFMAAFVTYMDVSLPLLSVGSTNPANSSLKSSTTPIGNYIAKDLSYVTSNTDEVYDVLNQFAGNLNLSGLGNYPVPWLGNLISSTGQFIYSSKDFSYAGNVPIQYNSNALYNKSVEETKNDMARNLDQTTIFESSTVYNIDKSIPDERAVCFAQKDNINKIIACLDTQEISTLRSAENTKSKSSSAFIEKNEITSCNNIQISANNRANLLPGPKIEVKRVSETYSGSEICWNFGVRNINQDIKAKWSFKYDRVFKEEEKLKTNLNCSINPEGVVYRYNDFYQQLLPVNCTAIVPDCNFASGTCNFPGEADVKNTCFNFQHSGENEIYKRSESSPFIDFPTATDIDGINTSLYTLLSKVNNELGERGLALSIPDTENFGWEGIIKQVVHDEGKKKNPQYISEEIFNTPYYYTGETSESCLNPKNTFFDNSMPVANGNALRQANVYYPLAGWIQILSDIITGYLYNSQLPDVQIAPKSTLLSKISSENVLRTAQDNLELNTSEDQSVNNFISSNFIQTGYASKILDFPLYSCDEIKECQESPDSPLCPLKGITIPKDKKYACLTLKGSADDTNLLKNYLCNKGYVFEDVCGKSPLLYCAVPNSKDLQSSTSAKSIATSSGEGYYVVADLNKTEFSATARSEVFSKSTKAFAESKNLDFAINTNFYDTNRSPLGMFGVSPNIVFDNLNPSREGAEFALVWHDGKLKTGDPEVDKFILYYNSTIAIIDTRKESLRRTADSAFTANEFNLFKPHIKIAISGIGLFGSKSPFKYLDTEYSSLRNSSRATTIIGVRSEGKEVVFIALGSANLDKMQQEIASLKLEYAIIFDAGHSSQMYSKTGFPSANNVYEDGKVYAAEFGNALRQVAGHIGFKTTESAQKIGSTDYCNCLSSGDNSVFKLIYPVSTVRNKNTGELEKTSVDNIWAGWGGKRTINNVTDYHTGVDWDAPEGSPILAAFAGTVYSVGNDERGYGRNVLIEHANGTVALYAHMSEILVKEGDYVNTGKIIGKVGNTGRSTGAHLHFELRKGKCAFDGNSLEELGTCSINPVNYFVDQYVDNIDTACRINSGDNTTIKFANLLELAKKVEELTGVAAEFLLSIMSIEARPDLEQTLSTAGLTNSAAVFTGDPYDRSSNPGENAYKAAGPFQFVRCFWVPYGVADSNTARENFEGCDESSYNVAGRNYKEVIKCVQGLGMKEKYGDVLDRTIIGHAMCAMGVKSMAVDSRKTGKSIQDYPVTDYANTFSENNPYWNSAKFHYCGNVPLGTVEGTCTYGYWYSDAAVGRAAVFYQFWDDFINGTKDYSDVFYYSNTLNISCANRSLNRIQDCIAE